VRLTVLGSSNAVPRPGRACSAYLIEAGGRAIAADFGTGAFSHLGQYRAFDELDAIFISHMHADHFIDVIPLRYALKYGQRTNDRKVALWLPPDGEAMLRAIVGVFARESHHDFLDEVFDVRTYELSAPVHIGDIAVRFSPTRHYIPTFALRADCAAASVTYSGDTAPCDDVVALARETDAFFCEATLLRGNSEYQPRGHCTAGEAGEMAQRAGAKRLILSHYSTASDPATMLAEAQANYAGPIDVADDHSTYEVG